MLKMGTSELSGKPNKTGDDGQESRPGRSWVAMQLFASCYRNQISAPVIQAPVIQAPVIQAPVIQFPKLDPVKINDIYIFQPNL